MQDKKGPVRRSSKEWAEILRRFDSSGLSAQEYCRRDRLSLSSFQRWRSRLAAGAAADFVELTPSRTGSTSSGWELEVTLPHGLRLQFRG